MSFHINSRLAKIGTFINSRDKINTRYTRLENPASNDIEMKSISHPTDRDTTPLISSSAGEPSTSDPPDPHYFNHPLEDKNDFFENIGPPSDSVSLTSEAASDVTTTGPPLDGDMTRPANSGAELPTPPNITGPSQVQSRNPAIIADAAAQAAAAGASQAISISANNYDSRIMGEYNARTNGINGNYIGMREHAQMIASARQSALNNHVAHTKLGLIFGGLVGGVASYFVNKNKYENGGRDKYLKDYNFKTLNLGNGTRIDPRDHETSTSFNDDVARDPNPTATASVNTTDPNTVRPRSTGLPPFTPKSDPSPVRGMSSGSMLAGTFREVHPNPTLRTSSSTQTHSNSASVGTQTTSKYNGIFYSPDGPNLDTANINNYPSFLPNSTA